MRDTNEGMIEILETLKKGDCYFSIIEVPEGGRKEKFRFGVTEDGYRAIKRILQRVLWIPCQNWNTDIFGMVQ